MANGKSATMDEKNWQDFVSQLTEVIQVFGGILMLPVVVLFCIAFGFRAGVIAGVEKALCLLKTWGS
jgi:hypothetical protein